MRHVEELPPYFLQTGSACYGAYRFMLVDESGLLPISVLGLCGRPMIKSPDVSDGDVIVVDVAIEAADSATRARAADLPTDEERTAGMIRAVAKRITQLGQ